MSIASSNPVPVLLLSVKFSALQIIAARCSPESASDGMTIVYSISTPSLNAKVTSFEVETQVDNPISEK